MRAERGRVVVDMHLEAREGLTGRPLSVLDALGERAKPRERRRTGLRLNEPPRTQQVLEFEEILEEPLP